MCSRRHKTGESSLYCSRNKNCWRPDSDKNYSSWGGSIDSWRQQRRDDSGNYTAGHHNHSTWNEARNSCVDNEWSSGSWNGDSDNGRWLKKSNTRCDSGTQNATPLQTGNQRKPVCTSRNKTAGKIVKTTLDRLSWLAVTRRP